MGDTRRTLLEIFHAALEGVNGERCVNRYLAIHPIAAPVFLIAVGKAACAMARGAGVALGDLIRAGLVITKRGHAESLPWPVIEAAHPVPDQTCLAAGNRLCEFVSLLPSNAHVLVLLSGGASALVEKLPPGANLETLREMNQWLLASGRDIAAVNRVRKRLSLLKGGRLAQLLAPRCVTCLAISDVAGDDPRFIGSGMLVADATVQHETIDDAPDEVRDALTRTPDVPLPDDKAFANVRFEIVARLADAKRAAADVARARGLRSVVHPEFIAGDAIAAGSRLARTVMTEPPDIVHIWGGETTITLPPSPGRGGRNQSLALSAAIALSRQPVLFLSAGTDGSDGPTGDAGALVDGATIERGERAGIKAEAALTNADAGRFLEASGDLISTGPTGTNVMDLMLGWRDSR